jgi:hypothetical protein
MAVHAKSKLVLGYSPYDHGGSITPFHKIFTGSQDVKEKGFKGVDAVVLWGGRDIHPSFYKQMPNSHNGAPMMPSERDIFEWKTMLYCRVNNIPLIGICRGAQFLCVGAGGTLIQHVTNHDRDHDIITNMGKQIRVTSTHHQMMNPYNIDHIMLGWANPARSHVYEGEPDKRVTGMWGKDEPEIVYFPVLKGLAIQGHPEYQCAEKPFIDLCNDLIVEHLFPAF